MNDDSHDKFENSASTGVYTTDVLNAEVKEETSTPHLLSKVDYYKISSRPNYLQYNNRSSFQRNDSSEKLSRPPRTPPPSGLLKYMRMTADVFQKIKDTIGSRPAETGGMLLGDPYTYEIFDFVMDINSMNSCTSYQPDTSYLNGFLDKSPYKFLGIAHSHPLGFRHLSSQDQKAAWSNLTSPGNPHLRAYLMPIVQTIPDQGKFELIPYIVTCNISGQGRVDVHRAKLRITKGIKSWI